MIEQARGRELLLQQKFDLIVVMGSHFVLDENGIPHYPSFEEGKINPSLNVEGAIKAAAIEQIFLHNMAPLVFVTGGMQEGFSRAEQLTFHTFVNHNVPQHFIMPITTRPHSIGNLEVLIDIEEFHPGNISEENVAVMTTSKHIKRVAKLATSPYVDLGYKPKFLSAEVILEEAGKISIAEARNYYRTATMAEAIESEKQGCLDIDNLIYQPLS